MKQQQEQEHPKRKAFFSHGGKLAKSDRRYSICAVIRNERTYIGISQCSEKDQFNRSIGRKLSESKAVHFPTVSIENTETRKAIDFLHSVQGKIESFAEPNMESFRDFKDVKIHNKF